MTNTGWAVLRQRVAAMPHAWPLAAGALATAGVAEAFTRAVLTGAEPQYGLVLCLLALATTLPLGFVSPAAATATLTAAIVLSLTVFGTLTVAGMAAQLAALYLLGRTGARFLPSLAAVPFPVMALAGPTPADSEAAFLTAVLASLAPAAVWVAIALRARGEALVHRSARQAVAATLLEHTARGERARIARELHDVVAHHISMISVQAETARLTTPGMPDAGAQRLSEIGDTARAGLTEMRRLLGVLREDARAGPAERRPQPGLQELNELLDEAREASGAGTRLIVSGSPRSLDPGIELAAYRIVQEALTNARRHAPGAAVDVELHYDTEVVRLRIRDNGAGPRAAIAPGGHGLAGMRERAAAVDGELRFGNAPGGGFVVEAALPARLEEAG